MSEAGARAAILRSCGILFLFRALYEAADDSRRTHMETQLVDAIADLSGASGGAVILAGSTSELHALVARRTHNLIPLDQMADAIGSGNPFLDTECSAIACPIHKYGRVCGMLAIWFVRESLTHDELEERLDTLIGIATIGSYAIGDDAEIAPRAGLSQVIAQVTVPGVIAESAAMQRLLRMVCRVAPAETTVLIEGESGTGKEVIARALHDLSARRSKPFIAINCAVLTENLLESELFGHERGAFTGAVAQKKGKVELAEGGTLFLDEIGELAPGLQAKLLRVLQQREFERVGGTRTMRLDVRVIAATNRDLQAEVKKGAFREDLYHRLNVISLETPPLRERPDDILPLALFFLEKGRTKASRKVLGFSPNAKHYLLNHPWSGNVRELENAVERALILGDTELIECEDLPPAILETARNTPAASDLDQTISSAKRDSIVRAWTESNGDYRQAAVILGLHPNSLLRLVKKLNLRSELRG